MPTIGGDSRTIGALLAGGSAWLPEPFETPTQRLQRWHGGDKPTASGFVSKSVARGEVGGGDGGDERGVVEFAGRDA